MVAIPPMLWAFGLWPIAITGTVVPVVVRGERRCECSIWMVVGRGPSGEGSSTVGQEFSGRPGWWRTAYWSNTMMDCCW